jgi:hypothetical protein
MELRDDAIGRLQTFRSDNISTNMKRETHPKTIEKRKEDKTEEQVDQQLQSHICLETFNSKHVT